MKRALIFGMSGQAGYYLSRFLYSKGYEVRGTYGSARVEKLPYTIPCGWDYVNLGNPIDRRVEALIEKSEPDEIYNLAAQTYAPDSWKAPSYYMQVNAMVVGRMLETFRRVNPQGRFFQAGSADVFDLTFQPQYENTQKLPRTPYGVSKLSAQEMVRVYREKYEMHVCTGILFNMESPRRAKSFFPNKVAQQVAQVVRGERDHIELGRLTAIRDWGRTEEYVDAMWRMLTLAVEPRDYVIGTGKSASCLQFVLEAMRVAGVPDSKLKYERYTESLLQDTLMADPSRIKRDLGWVAQSSWVDVAKELVEAELGKSIAIGQS